MVSSRKPLHLWSKATATSVPSDSHGCQRYLHCVFISSVHIVLKPTIWKADEAAVMKKSFSARHIDIAANSVFIPPSFFLRDVLQFNQTLCLGWGFLKLLSLSYVSMNFVSVHIYPAEAANLCCFDGFSPSLCDSQSANTCKTSFNTCPLNIANASTRTHSAQMHYGHFIVREGFVPHA